MASFWFLDTLALYMLRYKEELDEYYMAVLISWLAGEIKLLRGNEIIKTFEFIYLFIFFLYYRSIYNLFIYKIRSIQGKNFFKRWRIFLSQLVTKYLNRIEYRIGRKLCMKWKKRWRRMNRWKGRFVQSCKFLLSVFNNGLYTFVRSLQDCISQEETKFLSNIDPVLVLNIIIDSTYDMWVHFLKWNI